VRLRLERNEFIPATDYVHAQRVRQKMAGELRASMRDLEALVTPAHPCGAFPNDAPHLVIEGRTVEIAAATSRYTRLFNLTGNPAVVLPCGMTADGLPLSLQVVGHAFDEVTMFRVARAYERETAWHTRHPVLS
jgi:aspartyl-tRNA(Asn)/glutamyl-tRNA(Gln) amidotransferase subunit A